MACENGGPLDGLIAFFEFLGDPIGGIVKGIANEILAAALKVFGGLTLSIPTLSSETTPQNVSQQTQWLIVYTSVASLLFAAIRMALDRRGEAGVTALKGLLRLVVVAAVTTTAAGLLATLSDEYADHLFDEAVKEQLVAHSCGGGSIDEAFLLLVLAFLLIIAAILHTILLYVRLGVMIILLGTLPLAAAASMTEWGGGWWRKHIGWLIAWLLYKPAVGLVMYSGSAMISGGTLKGDVNERIAGIAVMLLSAVALPALLKLVTPATAALGGGNAVGKGMSAIGGAVATGAKSVGGGAASAGRGAAAGGAGPRGATGSSGGAGSGGRTGADGGGGRNARPNSPSPGANPGTPPGTGGGAAGRVGATGSGAAAAAGPAAAGAAAAVQTGRSVGRIATGSLDGADGEAGHNTR